MMRIVARITSLKVLNSVILPVLGVGIMCAVVPATGCIV